MPPGDDAGVFLLREGLALVETVDVITPLVNDPVTFGAISSANSLSDVYAMGGEPCTALAIVGYPSCDYGPEVVRLILSGATAVLEEAGVRLIGGHCSEDPELKFGLSVTGTVDETKILRKEGARPGDVLILTKPIGTGILTTSLKGGRLTEEDLREAVRWMTTLNAEAAGLAVEAGAHACTDITGFGLLGHAFNMVRGSELDFVITLGDVPVMERVREMATAGMVPEGAYNNMKHSGGRVEFKDGVPEEERLILFDPQTSGGLLISADEGICSRFDRSGVYAKVIGRVVEGRGRIVVD